MFSSHVSIVTSSESLRVAQSRSESDSGRPVLVSSAGGGSRGVESSYQDSFCFCLVSGLVANKMINVLVSCSKAEFIQQGKVT